MNKTKKTVIAIIALLIVAGGGTGIYFATRDNDSPVTTSSKTESVSSAPEIIEISEIKLDRTEYEIIVGNDETITASVLPENTTEDKSVIYKSSDESIAVVDENGRITTLAVGECTVTVSAKADESITSEIKLTVAPVLVSEINAENIEVKEDSSAEIKATVNENATDKTLTYESSDKKIADVDSDGNVKGIKEGKCQITITSKDGACSVTVDVTVKDKYGVKDFKESKTMYSTGCNFRKGPGTDYDIIKYLDVNTKIKVTGEVDNWYEAEIDGKKGFVGKDVVQKSKVETQINNNNGGGSTSTNNGGDSSNNNGGGGVQDDPHDYAPPGAGGGGDVTRDPGDIF